MSHYAEESLVESHQNPPSPNRVSFVMNNASIIANASALMNHNILDEMNEGIASMSCPKFGGCRSITLHNLINTQKQWDKVRITLLCLLFSLKYIVSMDQRRS